MTEPIKITSDRLLLVEGSSDQGFFRALLDQHQRLGVQVEAYGGKTRLRSRLKVLTSQSDFQEGCRWLGVSRDANGSPVDAFRAIADALEYARQPVPANVRDTATSEMLAVRVLILPSATGKGELEDLIWSVVRESHPSQAE